MSFPTEAVYALCGCRASTLGLLALWLVCFSYACYLVMLQHVLSTRPYPFTIFAFASLCGDICICAAAAPQFLQVKASPAYHKGQIPTLC